ncbi:MAG: hypothetical protein EXQ90_03775 [Rhodospirillales bacterium]|nr:hypothetical protein [Rhodospirillales bacterium]
MNINANFDSGSIVVINAANPAKIRLALRPDTKTKLLQWFYFRVTGGRGVDCTFRIENAAKAHWADAWDKFRVAASYDRETWFRVPTKYDGKVLSFRHKPAHDSVFYAYAVPYTREQDLALIGRAQMSTRVRHEVLGQSIEGQDIDLLTIGKPGRDKYAIWITARHHPSETQGPYAVEGLVHRLIDEGDALASAVLKRCVFYVIPNINPDGSRNGNHRCSGNGTDLNREWSVTTMKSSPEVYVVRKRILKTGLDVFVDLHAAERYTFTWGVRPSGIPSWSRRLERLADTFDASLSQANPDHEPERRHWGYPAGTDPLAMSGSWAAETFKTFGLIIEFPFLDEDNTASEVSWQGDRSRRYGASMVDAVHGMLDELGTPWATQRRKS